MLFILIFSTLASVFFRYNVTGLIKSGFKLKCMFRLYYSAHLFLRVDASAAMEYDGVTLVAALPLGVVVTLEAQL